MKRLLWIAAAGWLCLSGCGNEKGNIPAGTADVVGALDNLTTITTSQLGKSIRFVPLETTDSSLVNGQWSLKVTNDKAIVSNSGSWSFGSDQSDVLVFDLNTGKFEHKIGQPGQGPADYMFSSASVDRAGEHVYLIAGSGPGYVKYNVDGTFEGRAFGEKQSRAGGFVEIGDSTALLISYDISDGLRRLVFTRYLLNGVALDSVVAFENQPGPVMDLNFSGGFRMWTTDGAFPLAKQSITIFKDDNSTRAFGSPTTYSVGGELHFHEPLCDTVYRVSADGVAPTLTFNLGERRYPFDQLNSRGMTSDELAVVDIVETPDYALFGLVEGWVDSKGAKRYIGLYNRADGTTKLAPKNNGIEDDLGGFMPFNLMMTTPDGRLVGSITTEEMDKWLEENPGAEVPAALADLDPEANPILVIITP